MTYEQALTRVLNSEPIAFVIAAKTLGMKRTDKEWRAIVEDAKTDSRLDVRSHGRYGYEIILGQWMKD